MKNLYLTLLSILFFGFAVHAQESKPLGKINAHIILDGKLLPIDTDTLKHFKEDDIDYATVIKDTEHKAIFGVNDEQMLLIIITKANKNKPENVALREKLSKINFAGTPKMAINPVLKKPSKDSIASGTFDFVSIEKQPQFPGGIKAFYQYLGENIKYPKEAQKNKIFERVFLSFIVEKNGELSNIKLIRGVSSDIDAEAIRVVSGSPKWSPGIQFGVPVRVKYNINVNFNLN